MARQLGRRQFVKTLATGTVLLLGGACAPSAPPVRAPQATAPPAPPTAKPAAPAAPTAAAAAPTVAPAVQATTAPAVAAGPTGRLVVVPVVVATQSPFGWKTNMGEKPLWDSIYDPLLRRDPKTYALIPCLATDWGPSSDYKTWTFKLRQGVTFHENYGELTGEDVKFTIEQNLRPDANGTAASFFRARLDKIELPDKYTVIFRFKSPVWEVPGRLAQMTGSGWISSKKHIEAVGEEKATTHPIGTGPYHFVGGTQGAEWRFEAVQNHWRQTPAFKELVIRNIIEPAAAVAALRAGEVDIVPVTGDYITQAKQAGFRIHEQPNVALHWITLIGQTTPDREDYCPTCPWIGEPTDQKSQENARKVRLALNHAVNKKAIVDNLFRGYGAETPFSYWYFPFMKGYSQDWKIPPYDPARAKQLLTEAGYPNGFEIIVSPQLENLDGPDIMEAVALDWEKLGLKVKRVQEAFPSFLAKQMNRKTRIHAWPYGTPAANDEAVMSYTSGIHTKGTFSLLSEGPYDKDVDAISAELDADKRATLSHDLGQRLYDDYRGVMIGMKSALWAVSKKVGNWPTLGYSTYGLSYEYITPA